MRKGVLQQFGKPQQLYDHPVNLFVATFIGSPAMNLFKATIEHEGGGLTCVLDQQRIPVPEQIASAWPGLSKDLREVALGVRPEHLMEAARADETSARLRGEVQLVEALGSEQHVHISISADPVLNPEVMEVIADTDVGTLHTLEQDAKERQVVAVARFEAGSAVNTGEVVDVAVAPDRLQFFDLETGLALR
jgi:multiple sugar transport system ATP-binding protein